MYCHTKTQFKDKQILVEALVNCGIPLEHIEVHEKAQHLYGFQGDRRKQTAEIIIRKKHVGSASNDIGFALSSDGTYEAIISEYDSHKYNGSWLLELKKNYARGISQKIFASRRIPVQVSKREDGTIRLVGYVRE